MKRKFLLLIICLILLTGCDNETDNMKFKNEYERDNETLFKLEISDNNIIKYTTKEEVTNIINNGSGVIYIGSELDNECRQAISILLEAASYTDLDKIYYLNETNIDFLKLDEEEINVPIILFIYEGNIKQYNMGIGNNETLNEIEIDDLFMKYSDGIHKVLNDICDEVCDD